MSRLLWVPGVGQCSPGRVACELEYEAGFSEAGWRPSAGRGWNVMPLTELPAQRRGSCGLTVGAPILTARTIPSATTRWESSPGWRPRVPASHDLRLLRPLVVLEEAGLFLVSTGATPKPEGPVLVVVPRVGSPTALHAGRLWKHVARLSA